jgi:hypothetical protein
MGQHKYTPKKKIEDHLYYLAHKEQIKANVTRWYRENKEIWDYQRRVYGFTRKTEPLLCNMRKRSQGYR